MGVVTVLVHDITKAEEIQLLLPPAAGGGNGKQHRPGNEAAEEANGGGNLEIAEKEVPIKRLVVQNISVRDLIEFGNPVEQPIGELWRTFP